MKKQGWGKRFTVRPYGGTYKRFVHHTVAFGFMINIKSGIPFKRIGRKGMLTSFEPKAVQ